MKVVTDYHKESPKQPPSFAENEVNPLIEVGHGGVTLDEHDGTAALVKNGLRFDNSCEDLLEKRH